MTGFVKAHRTQSRVRAAVTGPSGAGKTEGALNLARALAGPKGKIALADTEAGSASLYSDRFDFDTLAITPPYESAKFISAIQQAVEGGYDVLVIDSISHQWDGDGGILDRKTQADARGGNHFSNWKPFTEEHNRFRSAILNCPIHLIVTMRSKMEYALDEGGGKKAPKKVGLAPIQRDGMEYEFTLVFDVQMDHKALPSKDRTEQFEGKGLVDLRDKKVGARLLKWSLAGDKAPTPPVLTVEAALNHIMPVGNSKGKPLSALDADTLKKAATYFKARPEHAADYEAVVLVLETVVRDGQPAAKKRDTSFDDLPEGLKGGDDRGAVDLGDADQPGVDL